MLGVLARNLRMFGFDAVYERSGDFPSLLLRAVREGRWLLTRRRVKQPLGSDVVLLNISEDPPEAQTIQVLRAMPGPPPPDRWFTRCLRCNDLLREVSPEECSERVPEYVLSIHSSFRECPRCGRVYWGGSHSERMRKSMIRWLKDAGHGIHGDSHGPKSGLFAGS